MNEPLRLRDGDGAARALMQGSELPVPHAARRRALAFAAAAANMAAGGAAMAAGGTALAKSVALCVCVGVVGGGLASLGVSATIERLERAPEASVSPVKSTLPAVVRARPASPVVEAAPLLAPAPVSKPELAPEPSPKEPSPVRASGVATAPSAATAGRPSLFDEQRSIEKARAGLAHGDASSALATLDEYERRFPKAQFRPEALALRIEALSQRGELSRARGLAAEFRERYPHHPLLSRVEAAVRR